MDKELKPQQSENRKGFITITDELYKNEWEWIYVFLKDFRPTHIEFRHWENGLWYMYGVSRFFDEKKEGEPLQKYDVWFTREKDGSLTYEFRKVLSNGQTVKI